MVFHIDLCAPSILLGVEAVERQAQVWVVDM